MKRFSNGRGFWCLGGKAAKNYREKSVDVAGYDELAAFDEDIEKEGSPTFLGDKRIEGSVWPKSIRDRHPKLKGPARLSVLPKSRSIFCASTFPARIGEEQYLKFGDKETPFGFKWTPGDPASVIYLCEHNACVIKQQELDFSEARYICDETGSGLATVCAGFHHPVPKLIRLTALLFMYGRHIARLLPGYRSLRTG
jgi:phage terminase large subunit GpA-like protein